jgi:single-strand DNA-binding protein
MARDLNKVMLIGRLGADPEMRYTPSGSPVTSFRLAVGRQWRDGSGENHDDTEWFNIVVWNKLAEICNQYLTKGTRVYLEGRLQTRSWEDQQSGQTRYRTEVIVSDMIMLDGREGRAPRESDDHPTSARDLPRSPRGGQQSTPPPDIGDEDIPF